MKMWSRSRPNVSGDNDGFRSVRRRALIWGTLAALFCGLLELGQPADDLLRTARNRIRQHPASGQIVVVGIDKASLDAVGSWPWSRDRHGELVSQLNRLGARSISFDLEFPTSEVRGSNRNFASALARTPKRVAIAASFGVDPLTQRAVASQPSAAIAKHVDLASINVRYDYSGNVPRLYYRQEVAGRIYPSMATKLAGVARGTDDPFRIDYAIDPRSVPTVSAVDLLRAGAGTDINLRRTIAGRDVIVATTARSLGDLFPIRGYARMPGVYIHVLGAETLRAGTPVHGGWLPAFLVAFFCAALSLRVTRLRRSNWVLASGFAVMLAVPIALEDGLIFLDVFPGMLLLLAVASGVTWASLRRSYRDRGIVNAQSGLLNLDALRLNTKGAECVLIAARIGNYAQIAAALNAEEETALVRQIAQRLTVGSRGQELYQGDEGIFAWFTPTTDVAAVGQHLEGLQGFFRESINLGDKQVDLAITFGLDTDGKRSPANRLGSALVACEEAGAEGVKWKAYDPAALADASWKLSLLGQLDRAIGGGDFWIAYQPKLDLHTGLIVGAEALARWTHPTKGPIPPVDFILAAEQSDRIERLTHFVLDGAIAAAARINKAGYRFNVAVNLSTRLIGDPGLVHIVEGMLRRHDLEARHLTLEVTETAAMGTGETNLATLRALRDLGICISVDDYGTGLSTLDYLKKIPATEIKIDQTFVGAITRSQSDRLMVRSTIQLVHSLGHAVVAEGVEDQATIDALVAMGCDYAQGFFIGRPMPAENILRSLGTKQISRAQRG